MFSIFEVAVKILLAGLLGGIIGYERQNSQRPAGLRTHILVCVSAALVMVTSEFIFDRYHTSTNMDPARLGAQVISGIGFLGAGTIIRDGVNVKGLTTAASLWAVACVGLSVGIGFYSGAVITTVVIFLTLIFLRKFENNIPIIKRDNIIFIKSLSNSGWIDKIVEILKAYDIPIKDIEFINKGYNKYVLVKIIVTFKDNIINTSIIEELQKIDQIEEVYIK